MFKRLGPKVTLPEAAIVLRVVLHHWERTLFDLFVYLGKIVGIFLTGLRVGVRLAAT